MLCRLRNDSGCLQPIFNPCYPAFWRSLALRYPYCDAEHDLGRGAEHELNLGSSPGGFGVSPGGFGGFTKFMMHVHSFLTFVIVCLAALVWGAGGGSANAGNTRQFGVKRKQAIIFHQDHA